MFVDYNGVRLSVIDLLEYKRTNVYSSDGVDLLYVTHKLAMTCTLAPGGSPRMVSVTELSDSTGKTLALTGGKDDTASILEATPRGRDEEGVLTAARLESQKNPKTGPVAQEFWHSGVESDAELRNRLAIPRKKLILWGFSRVTGEPIRWLESPRRDMDVDATIGPLPISWDVVSVAGEPNAVGIFFQISTDVTPCPVGSDRFVLSHRWTTEHGCNQDQYLTRVIKGEIVFHGGVKEVLKTDPDRIRNQFIHPVPLGMQRQPVQIIGSSDGLTLNYTIYDVDPSIVFSPGDSGGTQLEISERVIVMAPLGDDATFLP